MVLTNFFPHSLLLTKRCYRAEIAPLCSFLHAYCKDASQFGGEVTRPHPPDNGRLADSGDGPNVSCDPQAASVVVGSGGVHITALQHHSTLHSGGGGAI